MKDENEMNWRDSIVDLKSLDSSANNMSKQFLYPLGVIIFDGNNVFLKNHLTFGVACIDAANVAMYIPGRNDRPWSKNDLSPDLFRHWFRLEESLLIRICRLKSGLQSNETLSLLATATTTTTTTRTTTTQVCKRSYVYRGRGLWNKKKIYRVCIDLK